MKRSAPALGYDFGSKRDYRRHIWGAFRNVMKSAGTPRSKATALLMPSSEGAELKIAAKTGFRAENLICLDRNPALLATLKRRTGAPFTSYGIDLQDVGRRLEREKRTLDAANLDLCSPMKMKNLFSIQRIACRLAPTAAVAVTVLRGRERGVERELLHKNPKLNDAYQQALHDACVSRRKPSKTDGSRAANLALELSCGNPEYLLQNITTIQRCGVYRSTAGSQTMLWVVFRVDRREALIDRIVNWFTHAYRPDKSGRRPTNVGFSTFKALLPAHMDPIGLLDSLVDEATTRALDVYQKLYLPPGKQTFNESE